MGSRGGGKSELLSMIPLKYCDDKYYRGISFRREYSEIMGANGLWQKAEAMYPLFDGHPLVSKAVWKWPSGAQQQYRHMQHENDKESHRGQGYSAILVDEISQFSKTQITFLMTCLRSEANMSSFLCGTTNPDCDSWILPLIEWYLDDRGYPREDRVGAIRYFVVKDGDFLFADTEEWFAENEPDTVFVKMPGGTIKYVRPKTFCYFFFTVEDNEALQLSNPSYISELYNLPDHERESQLYGNWYAKPEGSSYFKREWLRGAKGERVKEMKDIPDKCIVMRGVDKAHSEPSELYRYPDFTAFSPRMYKTKDGFYYLVGDYHNEIVDPVTKNNDKPILGRFRKRAGERDHLILKQALYDGLKCSVVLARDKGAGAGDHQATMSLLMQYKVKVVEDRSQSNVAEKKVKDFQNFASACQRGLVYIVENSFDAKSLEAIYKELERFDGSKSTSLKKDDFVDSISICFNNISTTKRPYSTPSSNQYDSPTTIANMLGTKRI